MSTKFIKRKEDFICEKCGVSVSGSGYTNHCTNCLYSKHVDVNPGDREAACGGLMEPVSVEAEKGNYMLTHKCLICGHTRRNRVSKNDNFDQVVLLAKKRADKGLVS